PGKQRAGIEPIPVRGRVAGEGDGLVEEHGIEAVVDAGAIARAVVLRDERRSVEDVAGQVVARIRPVDAVSLEVALTGDRVDGEFGGAIAVVEHARAGRSEERRVGKE